MSACLDCPRFGPQIEGGPVRAVCCCDAPARAEAAAARLRDTHPMLNRRERRAAVRLAHKAARK
jgi:hypothetical protein